MTDFSKAPRRPSSERPADRIYRRGDQDARERHDVSWPNESAMRISYRDVEASRSSRCSCHRDRA